MALQKDHVALAILIGQRIVSFREKLGLTSEQLAVRSDVSKSYMSEIERGRYLPSLAMLSKISKVLKVELKDLL